MATIYLIVLNIITFAAFGIDKFKAIYRRWRIPAYVLVTLSVIGGSLGGFIGMKVFQHKTRVPYFAYGLPIMLIIHTLIFLYVYINIYDRI